MRIEPDSCAVLDQVGPTRDVHIENPCVNWWDCQADATLYDLLGKIKLNWREVSASQRHRDPVPLRSSLAQAE